MKNISYEERLDSLRLPSLEFRQSRGDLIEMYKLTHNIYDTKTTKSLFHISTQTNTRGHPYKVIKRHTNTKKNIPVSLQIKLLVYGMTYQNI